MSLVMAVSDRVHVLDQGRTIAEVELPGPTSGNPMTFMHQGRQYIVVAVSARGEASELVALTLPGGN